MNVHSLLVRKRLNYVWDSYGEGLMKCGDMDEAIDNYRIAVNLAEKSNHINQEVCRGILLKPFNIGNNNSPSARK